MTLKIKVSDIVNVFDIVFSAFKRIVSSGKKMFLSIYKKLQQATIVSSISPRGPPANATSKKKGNKQV